MPTKPKPERTHWCVFNWNRIKWLWTWNPIYYEPLHKRHLSIIKTQWSQTGAWRCVVTWSYLHQSQLRTSALWAGTANRHTAPFTSQTLRVPSPEIGQRERDMVGDLPSMPGAASAVHWWRQLYCAETEKVTEVETKLRGRTDGARTVILAERYRV